LQKKNKGKDEALSYTEDSGVIYEMNKAGKSQEEITRIIGVALSVAN